MTERKPVEAHELFEKAFNAADLDALVALYEPNAVLVSGPDQKQHAGHAAIRAALEGFLAMKGKMQLQTRHAVQSGDLALLRCDWRIASTGPDGKPMEMTGSTAEVVRRQSDGSWRYVLDHPFGAS